MKRCPYCAEEIQEEAVKCKHCGSMLTGHGADTLDRAVTIPGKARSLEYDTLDVAATSGREATILAGQYRIIKKLGEGGMGVVYLAEDTEMGNRPVAIKVLPPLLSRNIRAVENLRKEAITAINLNHPDIIRLYGFHSDADIKFLVMEYIEGVTLEEKLAKSPEGKLGLDETIAIAQKVAAALDYAHSCKHPVFHRDLKPSNIMIGKDGEVKLLDFGIAREMKDSYTRVTGKEISGTLPYMSPQQLIGARPDASMDIYSLGAVVYECLAGHTPFYTGDIKHQILNKRPPDIADVPEQVNAALRKALSKEPAEGPKTASDLIELLKAEAVPARECKKSEVKQMAMPTSPQEEDLTEIKSPIIGTCYVSPSPNMYPYVEVGSQVGPQTVVCIIEAMMVMNEIKAKVSGTIVEVLCSNGRRVEYDQPLFRVQLERSVGLAAAFAQGKPGAEQGTAEMKSDVKENGTVQRPEPAIRSRAVSAPDLVEVSDAPYASLDGLSAGSQEAQERQRHAVEELGLPLEVRTRKTGIVLRLIPRLTRPFYCGKFPVTQGQWEAVMGNNPSEFGDVGKDTPIENVTWEDCQAFLMKLCEKENVPEGTYRLLTEAEWEHACRAGTATSYCFGDNDSGLADYAWYYENSGFRPPIVGQKRPNAFGLYDMHGGVWEWCGDSHLVTEEAPAFFPRVSVYRGGSWLDEAENCQSTARGGDLPGVVSSGVGLRLARAIPSLP